MTKQDMEGTLNSIVEKLGDIYLGMSDQYPQFFDRLDREFSCFKQKEKRTDTLVSVSENVTEFFRKKEEFTDQNHREEEQLIGTIDKELEKLSRIEEGISGLEECSEDLELISLNAMVSALKAGNNGGAFPYITRELQRVSRLSGENSNSIRMQGRNLDREYKSLIQKIQSNKKETGEDMGRVFGALEEVISRLSFYSGTFEEQCVLFQDGIGRMRSPLYMILEEVQKHDIVRQSVNHIIISLDEIQSIPREGSLSDQLNHLKFASQVYELSRFIIDDIRESVFRSFERFSHEKRGVEEIISNLGREMDKKLREIARDDIGKRIAMMQNSLGLYFSSQEKNYFLEELNQDHFIALIVQLEEGITRFSKVLSSIRSIHVASRIEVVKLNKLENMENIISNIDETVSTMEDQLARIGESVDEFKKASGEIIMDFVSYFSQMKDRMQENMANLEPILDTIESYRKGLEDHINQFSQVNRDFLDFTGLVNRHLANMEALLAEIDRMRNVFDEERMVNDQKLQALLEESGRNDWTLEGDRITTLINKFTIFIHKKVMTGGQDEGAVSLDREQAGASEITLF